MGDDLPVSDNFVTFSVKEEPGTDDEQSSACFKQMPQISETAAEKNYPKKEEEVKEESCTLELFEESDNKFDVTGNSNCDHGNSDTSYFECEHCNRRFRHKSNLRKHLRLHLKVKAEEFTSKSLSQTATTSLQNRSIKIIGPFPCQFCEKTFWHTSHRLRHSRIHSGEKPYNCLVCDKTFARHDHAIAHTRTHTRESPFQCQDCDKSYSQKSHLIAHQRTHTGERPFQCEMCDKNFTDGSTLRQHRRIHTGEKPYSCMDCGKSFRRIFHLNRHKMKHTVQPFFQCEDCRKCFSDETSFNRHCRIHTKFGQKSRVSCQKEEPKRSKRKTRSMK